MTPEQLLIKKHPVLFHMASDDSWKSIKIHGLRCTSMLLDLFETSSERRRPIECQRRSESFTITHKDYGRAQIRDNLAISDKKLKNCLVGMTPTEWYELLNKYVFFWPSEKRLLGFLNAKQYRNQNHCVITISTEQLLKLCGKRVKISYINSGSTNFLAPKRGRKTFQNLENSIEDLQNAKKKIVEIAVKGSIEDIERITLRVERRSIMYNCVTLEEYSRHCSAGAERSSIT